MSKINLVVITLVIFFLMGCSFIPVDLASVNGTVNKQSPAEVVDIEFFHPTQLVPGGKRDITTKLPRGVRLEAVEVTSPEGIVVSNLRQLDYKGASRRWRMTFSADPGTPPGERSVVLVTSRGRSAPQTVMLPPHVPELLELEVVDVQLSPLRIELSGRVRDVQDDLGEAPGVTSLLQCGGSFLITSGSARDVTKVGEHEYHFTFSVGGDPNTRATGEAACKLEVTVTDEQGYEGELETAILLKQSS